MTFLYTYKQNLIWNMENTAGVRHLAIIMDGNRRWAKQQGMPAFKGHEKGYETLRKIADHCLEKGIEVLTVFAFSTENWKRAKDEVDFLLTLFVRALSEQIADMHQKGVRVKFIGDRSAFSPELASMMNDGEELTKNNTRAVFNIAMNYGGRPEILHAIAELSKQGADMSALTEDQFSSALYTASLPDPDLIIRTSGEQRLSGFLPWQGVYSELYFTNLHWPDFLPSELDKALEEFASRQRRFGQ